MVVIGQKTLRENLGVDVMAKLKASVLTAQGCQDGAVLRPAMAVKAFVPDGDVPGDVDDEVTLTLPSQRPVVFQDPEVEMRDPAGVLETAVETAVDHGSPPECAKMLGNIVCLESFPGCRSMVTTSLSSRLPGMGWKRGRAPGSRCRACLMGRRPRCKKSSRRCI